MNDDPIPSDLPSPDPPGPRLPFPKNTTPPNDRVLRAIRNWNELNEYLKSKPAIKDLEAAMNLESQREKGPRIAIIERLFAKWVKARRQQIYRAVKVKAF
jgi:hypothetical protein